MGFNEILVLLGGLGAFLFGMKYMGSGLESAAGPKLSKVMEKLTRNPVKGFFFGVGATAVIQSSAAATVMVMGLINAGVMDLAQAATVIIGSNIGTTVTSILIAADISFIAPFCIFLGGVLFLYGKKKKLKNLGQIVVGFGFLFQGLKWMSGSMEGLKDAIWFQNFVSASNSNPLIGFLIGLVACAIMQSSSASVGVVQALALQGLMPISFASFLICGINVGSSMPPFLSSLNAKNNAKRAAFIYFFYNLVGALIFIPISLFTPYTRWIEATGATQVFQISMLHVIFKVVTAILVLPFTKKIVKLSYVFIPKQGHEGELRLEYIDTNLIGSPATSVLQIQHEVRRLGDLVQDNMRMAVQALITRSSENAEKIVEQEDMIDYITNAITDYMVSVNSEAMPADLSNYMGRVFHVVNDLERIGDHALNIFEKAEKFEEIKTGFSETAEKELQEIMNRYDALFEMAVNDFTNRYASPVDLAKMERLEDDIDNLTREAENNHIARLRAGQCSTDVGVVFVTLMNDLERVGDHAFNVGQLANPDGRP